MRGQKLKILFRDDMAFLTEVALDFNQVQISFSPVRFKAAAFWTVRVINYIESEKRLFVEVLDYQVGETEFPDNQIQLADKLIEVEKVTFKSVDTAGLLMTQNGTQPRTILPPKPETVYRGSTPETRVATEPIKQVYSEPFSIPIKNVTFLPGRVAFEKKIARFNKSIEFTILNDDIIEEYDAIKNYFASVLKTKKIQVVPTITTIDGVITAINATSIEIERIDKTFIEEVKFEVVKLARKKEVLDDKQIFTLDEYLETFADEGLKAEQLYADDDDFINNILEKSETKHYKHLRFLSSKHNPDMQKLRLVHKPFSFIFLLGSIDKFHIVWETLDTQEATYIWTFDNDKKSLKQILAETDETITIILKEGKGKYISLNEGNFHRVFHDYSDPQNGFKNWKEEIEKVIS